MGSGVLLAALVVLWFVVLVPMVVTRGDARPAEAGIAPGRTLKRRRAVDPAVHADTERVAVDRDALRRTGEVAAVQRRRRPGRRRHRLRRHRRLPPARGQRLTPAGAAPGSPPVAVPARPDGTVAVRGAVAQSGSAPRSHRGGQGFKSPQ